MDPNNVSTVVYQINETLKEDLKNSPKYTVTRLDFTEEMYGDKKKKTFYVDDPSDDKDELVILSFGPNFPLLYPLTILSFAAHLTAL